MTHFTDPSSGRPYEVGPDGVTRWADEEAPAPGRPWYRRVRYVAPAAALLGFAVASAGGHDGSSAAPSASGPTSTVTTTATTTVTAAPTTAPAVTVTRTVPAKARTVRVTVTRTATTQPLTGGGGGGGGGGGTAAVYYANCSEARAAGAAPILVGEPGYRPALDRDGDGVACE